MAMEAHNAYTNPSRNASKSVLPHSQTLLKRKFEATSTISRSTHIVER